MVIRIYNQSEWLEVQKILLFELDCIWKNDNNKMIFSKYDSVNLMYNTGYVFIVERNKKLSWSSKEKNYILASNFLRKHKLEKLNSL